MSTIKKILAANADSEIKYRRTFWDKNDHCLGYSFPCDSEGNLLHEGNYDLWIQNYQKCISHPEAYTDAGVQMIDITKSFRALCSCGREFTLDGNSRCGCGQWYNRYGQPMNDMSDRAEAHYEGF